MALHYLILSGPHLNFSFLKFLKSIIAHIKIYVPTSKSMPCQMIRGKYIMRIGLNKTAIKPEIIEVPILASLYS